MRVYSRFDREFRALHGDWPSEVVEADFQVVEPDRSGLARALGAGAVPSRSAAGWRAEEARLKRLQRLGFAGVGVALLVLCALLVLALALGLWLLAAALGGVPAAFAQGPI